ncbi:conserved hypothetical protein [Psychromonas ingrahamii 37]|uniref:Uncharacterized protein n=1 Tax=Psychromonas ingrahamii (strain DSM 17664 / CCUG 51855 / 37) TaxID=357804 RepID=A1SXQ7_PSYIN|nr:conserved hypothetical protein [Psychromonas ingrahamii 37]
MVSPFISKKAVDTWIKNPIPSMSEPDKQVSSFTNIDRYDLDHQANLYGKGSLHAIDRFFMQIRPELICLKGPSTRAQIKAECGMVTGQMSRLNWLGHATYSSELSSAKLQALYAIRSYIHYYLLRTFK